MIVQACLNGARPPGFHPRLPLAPGVLAEDAAEAVAAGAAELHVHPRGADGMETLAPPAMDAAIGALRARLPGTLIGVSTGAWIERDADRTLACIASWAVPPDYASVNLSEPAAPAVTGALLRRGIGVEAGLAGVGDARRLIALDLGPACLRILVEIGDQDAVAAQAMVEATVSVLRESELRKPVLLHGQEATVWPLVAAAFRAGFSTRVGLEDGAMLPNGSPAPDNAALVAAACAMRPGRTA